MEWMAQGVAQRVIDLVVDSLDVNALIARIDLNAVLARVDLNVALGRVDVNQELGRVDLNQVLGRVDLNQELARVDLNQVIDRVDLNQVIDRVDINEIAGRIDIEALVKNTDLGALLASSSSTLATETIDLGRSHAVSMDDTLARWVSRLRRNHTGRAGPPELLNAQEEHAAPADVGLPEPMPHDGGTPLPAPLPLSVPQNLRGHYAGFASRFIAFVFELCPEYRGVRASPRRDLVRRQRANRNLHPLEQGQSVGGNRLLRLGVPLLRLLLDGER